MLDVVEPGRGVMTDRGFTIQNTCEEKVLYHFAPPVLETEQYKFYHGESRYRFYQTLK